MVESKCHCRCFDRAELADFTLGKLPAEQLVEIASQVETCPACQAMLETLDSLEDSVVQDLRRSPAPAPPSGELEVQLQRAEAIGEAVWHKHHQDQTDVLPRRLGQYELLEQIGRGGMGTVYKAVHMRLKRPVAIKLLPGERTRHPQTLDRFLREMEAVGRLDHPHLVRAHDAGECEGQYYLAMEFLEGQNLAQVVRTRGPLPIAEACEAVRQAALGLQYAHEHGLVHRDVKPSNLMLTPQGQVKVLDLGLARLVAEPAGDGEMTAADQVLGTGDFMAPEQASDTRQADARSDIYSLGCTLYFLLTGRAPFSDPQHPTLLKKLIAHANEPAPPIHQFRPDVPGHLVAALDRMLAKEPESRYASAAEVAHELEPWASGSPGASLSRGIPTATRPRSWRAKILLTLTGLVLVPSLVWYGQVLLGAGAKRAGNAALADAGGRAAVAYVTQSPLLQPLRDAVLTTLRQHPAEDRWGGRSGNMLFSVVAKPVPWEENRPQALPALLNLTHMLAVHELLGAKSLLDQYASLGLTDATTLRTAVIQVAGRLAVGGKAAGILHMTGVEGTFVVGYVVSDERALTAHLMRPPAVEAVKSAYRDVMHQQARDLMTRSNWSDALLLWNHLHQRKLVSPDLYLDAAQCFDKLGQTTDATKVLGEAVNAFASTAGAEYLERAGDLALGIKTPQADKLAENAYRLASDRLRESVSMGEADQPHQDR
jgi:serine/threonine protein kinase